MQIIIQIFKKSNRAILSLTLLMILTIVVTNYHNYKTEINENNLKNLINNIYFKKTLTNIFDQFEPKYESIDHIITKGQSLSNIFEKYSDSNLTTENNMKGPVVWPKSVYEN